MVAVRATGLGRKTGDNQIRAELPDHAHHIKKHLVLAPLGEGFLVALGEPEVPRPREKLLSAVDAPRGEEFLRADDAQRVTQFRANEVLAPFPAREGKIADAHGAFLRHAGDELCVLVVGMCGDVEHAAAFAELAQFLQNRGGGRWLVSGSERQGMQSGGCEESGHGTGEVAAVLPPDVSEHAQIGDG